MDISLKADLDRLRRFAFRRYKCCAPLLRTYHKMRREINAHQHARLLWALYHWLLVPLSICPVDVAGLAKHVLTRVARKKKLDDDVVLLVEMLGVAPMRDACDVMADYEHQVAKGSYEGLVRCHEKFAERERLLNHSKEFRATWRKIGQRFNLAEYRLKHGVIRRQMSQERNFRDRLNFEWGSEESRFRQLFDVLCYRWNLYGVKNSQPLLLKITVNPTPHGTMIFIPRYWSLALSRDLNGKAIARLHRAHGAIRQGPKMSVSRMERREDAGKALRAWNEAGRSGLRGDRRMEYILSALGKCPETDFSTVKRLLREARSLC